MPNTTTDSEEEMGQMQYARKFGQNPKDERQFIRKKYYKEEEEEEKAAKRKDMIMIIIFVCLCVIFVALVVLAIVLVLTGPKDPMTKWKTRGKTKQKK
ncbi:unnamed protein product [Cylicostephanus goldi]|uniref:Uncharacterized protein n=1 Tax=Cylicostephanus goldi TaxID=71465 RepID=A0A3P6T214_CYLGO|nr:unnamed protein product [Cylicostephanus goldi]